MEKEPLATSLAAYSTRSIRPKRARRPFDASVDPTEARNILLDNLVFEGPLTLLR